MQEDLIQSLAKGNDTLGLLPTGGGKSIIYQVYSMSTEGICLVITPLIALMKDQVANLKKRNIKAVAVFSGLSAAEIDATIDNCVYGDYKFLYLSPERLNTDIFKERVTKMNINLIAVDEAHCISQWGYDFRPSYLKIAEIRNLLPDVPLLALTATATPDVVDDIQKKLDFHKKNVLQVSFERKNLTYIVRDVEDKHKYLLKILNREKGCGVVYVRSRNKTKEIAELLIKNGISADYYHAGLDNEIRDQKQTQWMQGLTRVIVATNAFGMGIDKSDVRVVVHVDLPNSLEAYFQEAGRGGRDGKKAYAVLLYNESDKRRLEKSIVDSFPEKEAILKMYNAICNYYQIPVGGGKGASYDFNIYDFCKQYSVQAITVLSCFQILQSNQYLEVTDEVNTPSRIHFVVNRDDLYKYQVANAQMDGFIKLLLRTYSGVFTDFVPISEQMLASRTKVPVNVIYQFLLRLQNAHIIKYIPQKNTPSIIFLEERLDEKNILISKESFQIRKERFITRIESAINYATSETKCRSEILLSYFGDKEAYRCGQCDVCVTRNKLELSKLEFDVILNHVKDSLKKEPVKIDKLVDLVPYDETKVIKAVQWLLDTNKIKYTEDMKLSWHT
jgi:ATP-dependent DNA helicase RecQ